jgi:hypothetical protein
MSGFQLFPANPIHFILPAHIVLPLGGPDLLASSSWLQPFTRGCCEINNDVRLLVCRAKSEHFVNPPMSTFCCNSPNGMQKLQRDWLDLNEFVFAYLCVLLHMQYTIHA